jgi:DNA-binding LacI/PurR family transcriptional regulator
MANNQQPAKKEFVSSSNGRPTVGFLTATRGNFFHHLIWRGVADAARAHNVNAICFEGNFVDDPEGFYAQANILYDLIDVEQLDGLLIWSLIYTTFDDDEVRRFYDHYQSLPIVAIGRSVDGVTSIVLDNYGGMRDMLVHLIEVHGCRRIAYIKGLPNFVPHDDRYRAYVEVLAEYGRLTRRGWRCRAM